MSRKWSSTAIVAYLGLLNMAEVKVEIKNLDKLQSNLRKYPRIAQPILERAIAASGAVLAKNTIKDDPIPWKTSNLLKSFRYENSKLTGRWFPTAYYAIFVHEGTRPHVITPTAKKALFWLGAEHPVKSVSHPGTKPNKFMDALAKKAQRDIDALFKQATDRIADEIAKV